MTHWLYDTSGFITPLWLFTRGVYIVYLIAFASLFPQIPGLYGAKGISPAEQLLSFWKGRYGRKLYLFPTLFWWGAKDGALQFAAAFGMLLSVVGLVEGLPDWFLLPLCYLLYLSFITIGQDFLRFQWDALLLETGFLAIFLALASPVSPMLLAAIWILLFKLMFLSGLCKLSSGCPVWQDGTALEYHYWSQPLPNPLAWHVHHLPKWAHKVSCRAMLAMELAVPVLIFFPSPIREIGAVLLIALQIGIFLTGNYAFFNLLTIAICLPLFELAPSPVFYSHWLFYLIQDGVGLALLVLSGMQIARAIRPYSSPVLALISPFEINNHYGLFAKMTTDRKEIIIEGSIDGETWAPYRFHWKGEAPKQVAPHQPRLDWQMWFAALSPYAANPWFERLLVRLLKAEPAVLSLLAHDPFNGKRPKKIRARLVRYRFSDPGSKSWWEKQEAGPYSPTLELSS